MRKKLEDKVVFITHGSSFWGKALSDLFQEHGAKLILGVPSGTKGTHTDNCIEVPIQYTEEASWGNALSTGSNTFGQIDVLINNAGIGGGASFEETTPETFRSLMETNFFGAVDLTQRVLPVLRQKREGCIINVTSVAGVTSFSLNTAYSASKWALEAATETLAMEMQEFGVRVALIEPGVVLTPIFSKAETTDGTESAYKKFYERLNLSLIHI